MMIKFKYLILIGVLFLMSFSLSQAIGEKNILFPFETVGIDLRQLNESQHSVILVWDEINSQLIENAQQIQALANSGIGITLISIGPKEITDMNADINITVTDIAALKAQLRIHQLPQLFIVGPDANIISQQIIKDRLIQGNELAVYLPEANQEQLYNPDFAPLPSGLETHYSGLKQSQSVEGYPVLGDSDAEIVLENYSSFSCRFCLDWHAKVLDELWPYLEAGQLQIVYKPIYTTGSIPNSLTANQAAMCALDQGHFWEYQDILYHWHDLFQNEAFVQDRLKQGVIGLDLDLQTWKQCMSEEKYTDLLNEFALTFNDLGLGGTPAILINGERVSSDLDSIIQTIEIALKGQA